jgi:superfamily II DNA or RNA helicase
MKANLSEDLKFINITFEHEFEYAQMKQSFRKQIRDYHFKKSKRKFSNWDGYFNYLINDSKIYIGLWKELIDFCKKYNFRLVFPDYQKIIRNIDFESIKNFCFMKTMNLEFPPRKEQIEVIFKALKFRFGIFDLSQNFGKTISIYLYSRFGIENKIFNRVLVICPDPGLVGQNYNSFVFEYSKDDRDFSEKIGMVHGKEKKQFLDSKSIIISNFQYLVSQEVDFFKNFDCVVIDEGHKISTESIKKILEKCVNSKNVISLTGSLKRDNTADFFSLLAYSGPILMTVTKQELISRGEATPGKIFIIKLNWATHEERIEIYGYKDILNDNEKWLRQEQLFVRSSKKRLLIICKIILEKMRGNALIFFTDVKYGYGKKIVQTLKELSVDKNIFYIDEDVSQKSREMIREEYNQSNKGNILVTSYKIFATGINLKNIHDVFLAEATKDFVTLSQALGRPMRLHESKEEFHWYDFVDDLSIDIRDNITDSYKLHKNYLLKWQNDRIKIYKNEGFKYTSLVVNIEKNKKNLDF